ncbi:MAG TPA: LysM peptidoglycan-binding domain-containing protein [Desulfuromonadaceae bacterium]|nr:LysM peptidoglycan-binding domain-containing protein [Desulfuromonadaceae bacterium]
MNSANPFQIPSCFQKVDENRRRERFKRGVIAAIAAFVLLLVGLLIQGCKSERAAQAPAKATPVVAQTAHTLSPVPHTTPAVASQPVPSASKPSMTPATITTPHSAAVSVYVVKSGDTLARIAKTHGISVKNLKSANGLDTDHIAVGTKLKIPTA